MRGRRFLKQKRGIGQEKTGEGDGGESHHRYVKWCAAEVLEDRGGAGEGGSQRRRREPRSEGGGTLETEVVQTERKSVTRAVGGKKKGRRDDHEKECRRIFKIRSRKR